MNNSQRSITKLEFNERSSQVYNPHSDANISFHLSDNTYSISFANLLCDIGPTGYINLLNHLAETPHQQVPCASQALADCIMYHSKCFLSESTVIIIYYGAVQRVDFRIWKDPSEVNFEGS